MNSLVSCAISPCALLRSLSANRTLVFSMAKREMRGCNPAEAFEAGIRTAVQWCLANPEWVAQVQSGAYRDGVQTQYANV